MDWITSQSFRPLCCYVTSWCLSGIWVPLSLVLGSSKRLPFTDGMFTSIWLGILACGPLYHEKSVRYVSDIPGVKKLCGAHVALSQSVDVSLAVPAQERPAPSSWTTDTWIAQGHLLTYKELWGKEKNKQKRKQTRKPCRYSFSLFPFFPPGRQAAPEAACLFSGRSLARTSVCLTCLYKTLSAHRCPDAFLSNTDGAPGEVSWVKYMSSGSTGTQLAPIRVRNLVLNPGNLAASTASRISFITVGSIQEVLHRHSSSLPYSFSDCSWVA